MRLPFPVCFYRNGLLVEYWRYMDLILVKISIICAQLIHFWLKTCPKNFFCVLPITKFNLKCFPPNEHFSVSLSSNAYHLKQTQWRLIPLQSHKLSFYQSFSVQTIFYSLFGQTFWPIDSMNSVLQSLRDVLLSTPYWNIVTSKMTP